MNQFIDTVLFVVVIISFFVFPQKSLAQVLINEFSSSNSSDWVEIYNVSSNEVNLSGWSIKDTTSSLHEFSGEIIPVGGFCVQTVSNRLNNDGDRIQLFNLTTQIDCVSYGDGNGNFCGTIEDVAKPTSDQTASRVPDGSSVWILGISSQSSNSCNSLIPTPTPTSTPTSTPTVTATPTKTATPIQSGQAKTATPIQSGQASTSTPTPIELEQTETIQPSNHVTITPSGIVAGATTTKKSPVLSILFILSGLGFLGYGGYLIYNKKKNETA